MGLLFQWKSFLLKMFYFNQNFETRSRLHIKLYIMGHPCNMYTIISMYIEILFYSRATHICWIENNTDGHLLKVLICFFHFLGLTLPKIDLGFEIQKTTVGIRISILEIPCVPNFTQNGQHWHFLPKFAQKGMKSWEFRKLMSE